MESFDIDAWFNELPQKLSQLWYDLMQPVPLAIFAIFLVFAWQKLKLGKKFTVFFHKFFKLVRTIIVVGMIILIAYFVQYMSSGNTTTTDNDQVAQQKTQKQQPETAKPQPKTIQNNTDDIEIPKTTEIKKPQKTPQQIITTTLFNRYIFLLPDKQALQNERVERHYNEGLIAAQEQNYNKAVLHLSKVIGYTTQYAFVYCARGISYAKLGEYEKALADFDEAIFIDSSAGEVFNNRAVVFAEKQQLQIALRDFNNAIFLNKSISQIYMNRGYITYLLKDYEEAIYNWKKAISINNKYADQLGIWLQKAYDKKYN
ncbi:tetratricopeptide repeat protein [Candidatus Uabimicrobium amorphum]|uniref:Tetratricopeptide repeat protein n=1 Tax=Uabimicrobium amorphum TaxID=2596890 RepID=A0A5S9IP80_UABAM|nr:tetratricopeptide repeat protein [Candidatus Uabimicrobium amorphum]BBM84922.1 hypothetical protein UABAM_03283 [Candidatus Uabimicrobium amorphum]